MDGHKLIICDTETTGIDSNAAVCDVAWVEVDADLNIIESVESLIDPEHPIPPEVSAVHHITDDMVSDAPTISEFFSIVRQPIDGQVIFCAYNSAFDMLFMAPWIDDVAFELDMIRAARKFVPHAPNHKLQTLRYMFGLKTEGEAHRAMADVLTTLSLLRHFIEGDEYPVNSVEEMLAALLDPILIEKMMFGKHMGQAFSTVPKSYLNWMRYKSGMQLDRDLKHTVEHYLEAA